MASDQSGGAVRGRENPMDKTVRKYARLYRAALREKRMPDVSGKAKAYAVRLEKMYASDRFKKHNVYPSMNVRHVYAVIAMCLELRGAGLSDREIMAFSDCVFRKRKKFFAVLMRLIDLLPDSWRIARKWNIGDHSRRVRDGSITYDTFEVSDGKIEYCISKCMYVEMFSAYGIRNLCRIFCITDEHAYAGLARHVRFIRHSDLSDGPVCHDEIFRK